MNILVTGGGGFVGRHFIAEMRKAIPEVAIAVFDRSVHDFPSEVAGYAIDITDPESYKGHLSTIRPDVVVHLAAVSSVGFSLQNPELTKTVNLVATKQLIEEVLQVNANAKFFMVSSADIYAATPSPISELSLADARPKNPYAQSKWEMEQMIEENYSAICIRVRPFPHIGPGQQKGFVTADFASQIAEIEAGKKSPSISVGNLQAVRDFTDVRDVVRAYRLIIEQGVWGEVYNIASGVGHSIQEILDALLRLSNTPIHIEQDPSRMRPSDTPILIGDASKLRDAVGWSPEFQFSRTLTDILTDWRERIRTNR